MLLRFAASKEYVLGLSMADNRDSDGLDISATRPVARATGRTTFMCLVVLTFFSAVPFWPRMRGRIPGTHGCAEERR